MVDIQKIESVRVTKETLHDKYSLLKLVVADTELEYKMPVKKVFDREFGIVVLFDPKTEDDRHIEMLCNHYWAGLAERKQETERMG